MPNILCLCPADLAEFWSNLAGDHCLSCWHNMRQSGDPPSYTLHCACVTLTFDLLSWKLAHWFDLPLGKFRLFLWLFVCFQVWSPYGMGQRDSQPDGRAKLVMRLMITRPDWCHAIMWCWVVYGVLVGRTQRMKQARTEVQDEITAYRKQCEDECQMQENEVGLRRLHLYISRN